MRISDWSSDVCSSDLIVGRQRNRLALPDGTTVFPYFGNHDDYKAITPQVRRFQFIQRSLNEIEKRMVVSAPLTAAQEEQTRALMQRSLGHPFPITFTYFDELPLRPHGTYNAFTSETGRKSYWEGGCIED